MMEATFVLVPGYLCRILYNKMSFLLRRWAPGSTSAWLAQSSNTKATDFLAELGPIVDAMADCKARSSLVGAWATSEP